MTSFYCSIYFEQQKATYREDFQDMLVLNTLYIVDGVCGYGLLWPGDSHMQVGRQNPSTWQQCMGLTTWHDLLGTEWGGGGLDVVGDIHALCCLSRIGWRRSFPKDHRVASPWWNWLLFNANWMRKDIIFVISDFYPITTKSVPGIHLSCYHQHMIQTLSKGITAIFPGHPDLKVP